MELLKGPTETMDRVPYVCEAKKGRERRKKASTCRRERSDLRWLCPCRAELTERLAGKVLSWSGYTNHGVLDAHSLTLRVLQAVPSGYYLVIPHSSYFPISPRTLRFAALHLLAKKEPYSSKKTYAHPRIPLSRCGTGSVHAVTWSD